MAEALAVLAAINFALSHDLHTIAIHSDSQTLIQTINRKIMNLEIYGALTDIYSLSKSFNFISFSYIPRLENVRADMMAKQALWAVRPS